MQREDALCIVTCKTGMDRSVQISSLVLILLDPFYRTLKGFIVLIGILTMATHLLQKKNGSAWVSDVLNRQVPLSHCMAHSVALFVEWIDLVWQLIQQFPDSFEFNELLLLTIADHVHFGLFGECNSIHRINCTGTFLASTEEEMVKKNIKQTPSLWSFIHASPELYKYHQYKHEETILFPVARFRALQVFPFYVKASIKPIKIPINKLK